jgi:hypothetical protein
MYDDSVRPEIDNTYTIHTFLDFMSNLDTHINSNYLVTLLVTLIMKLELNLSRIKPINQKNHTQRKKDIFQRQQQRRTSSVSH